MKKLIISTLLMAKSLIVCSFVSAQEAPYLFILGVAQDAGYPQVGCYQTTLYERLGRSLTTKNRNIACVNSPDRDLSFLFEATPHLPEQLYALQKEAPNTRDSLDGVFLTHAHIGHYAGLMHFGREAMNAQGLEVYAMPLMSAFLSNNGPWSQLVALGNIALMPLKDNHTVKLTSTLFVTPMLVPHRDEFSETVGYRIEDLTRVHSLSQILINGPTGTQTSLHCSRQSTTPYWTQLFSPTESLVIGTCLRYLTRSS